MQKQRTAGNQIRQPVADQHLRQQLESVGALLLTLNLEFVITSFSPNIEHSTGLAPDQIHNRPLADLIHPDDVLQTMALCQQALQEERHITAEFRLKLTRDRHLLVRAGFSHLMENGCVTGLTCLLVDIHHHQQVESEPIASEQKYRSIVESMHEGYFEIDLSGRIVFCNDALSRISGYTQEKLIGKSYQDFAPQHTIRILQTVFGRVYQTGQDAAVAHYEMFHKDGHTLTLAFGVSLLKDKDGSIIGFRGILRDVSRQVKAIEKRERQQNQFQQAQKMEALGTLAGGLAHGFNNVLMAIQGNLSLMRMNMTPDNPMQKHISRIGQSTEKGVHLAKQILSFAKMTKFVVMPTNLNQILRSTSRMFVRTQSYLKIHEIYHEKLWQTMVDRVQIGQVLLGLYMNAAESMPVGGDLYLQSENITLDASYTQPYNLKPGKYVKISVTDSGPGLDEEAKQRIFEPFFIAQRSGRYDGLGLAATYGIIKSHNGLINVYSEKGHGTTFTIYLPISKKAEMEKSITTNEMIRGSETILLVDDDQTSLQAGKGILERYGYRVITVECGMEAVDVFTTYQDQINLVILDMILPDLDGEQVYFELKKRYPHVLVVLASGYNVNKKISALLNQGCADFIQKPFQTQSLSLRVRAVLDGTNQLNPVPAV